MKKILHFATDGGASPYINALAEFCDQDRFQLSFGSLSSRGQVHDELAARGVHTFALGADRRSGYFKAAAQLAAYVRRNRIDIVQTHLFDACVIGGIVARLAGAKLVVFTGHHSHEYGIAPREPHVTIDSTMARAAGGVLAHCEDMARTFESIEHVSRERIAVIPYAVDLRRISFSEPGRARVRAELGLEGRFVLGAVGRLYWIKNYPALIRALRRVVATNPETVLLIVGAGPDLPSLQRQIAGLGLETHVRFAGYRADVFDVMSAMDLLVHPSLAESFCQVLIEAVALRRPVVSSPVGIAPELLAHGRGYLIERPMGEAQIYDAISTALRAREDWPQVTTAATAWLPEVAADRVVRRYEDQYERWLTRL